VLYSNNNFSDFLCRLGDIGNPGNGEPTRRTDIAAESIITFESIIRRTLTKKVARKRKEAAAAIAAAS
jgi:hypothetical protein